MPKGTRVHRCVEHLKSKGGGNPYAICQKATGQSYKTGKSLGYKSHMPKGATQSPKGNLGNKSDQEYWVQRHFKESGHVLDAGEAFGSHVLDPGKQGSADYGTKATH